MTCYEIPTQLTQFEYLMPNFHQKLTSEITSSCDMQHEAVISKVGFYGKIGSGVHYVPHTWDNFNDATVHFCPYQFQFYLTQRFFFSFCFIKCSLRKNHNFAVKFFILLYDFKLFCQSVLRIFYVQVKGLIPVFVLKTKKRASDIGLLALCVLVHFIVMKIQFTTLRDKDTKNVPLRR